jgi:hypothetical protein
LARVRVSSRWLLQMLLTGPSSRALGASEGQKASLLHTLTFAPPSNKQTFIIIISPPANTTLNGLQNGQHTCADGRVGSQQYTSEWRRRRRHVVARAHCEEGSCLERAVCTGLNLGQCELCPFAISRIQADKCACSMEST